MFGWEFPPKSLGGLGVACQGLVRGLLKQNSRITLVLPHSEAELEDGMDLLSPTSEQIQRIKVKSDLHPYDTPESFLSRKDSKDTGMSNLYGRDLGAAVHEFTEMSVELTKHTNPDVVHAHDWMTFPAAKRAADYHNVPFVAQIHATELDRTHFKPNQWIYDQERIGLNSADHIITVSNFTKDLLIKEYGIDPDKIDVVHNATSHQNHQSPTNDQCAITKHPMILFLGRLTVQKGPFHFLEAARIVHEHNPEARFVIAGDGYLLPELIDRSCDMGLQDIVIFAGKVSGNEVNELYKKASCFVMPSTSEPFGLVALEAMAFNTPVIVSKQSGVREVTPHSFQVDFWDIDKLADCIITVLREGPLADQLRSEGGNTLQHLTWENQASKVISIYDKVRNYF
jgi:glycogen synthase